MLLDLSRKQLLSIALIIGTAHIAGYYLNMGLKQLDEYNGFTWALNNQMSMPGDYYKYMVGMEAVAYRNIFIGIILALISIATLYFGFIRPYTKRQEIK